MGQIREANEVYEQATIRKRDELIRLSEAKKMADLLYEKIAKTEGKIMRREKKYEEVKKTMEQQQKILRMYGEYMGFVTKNQWGINWTLSPNSSGEIRTE